MKIVFTGGGTGGHFYPIIAIAEAVHDIVREQYLVPPKLYYIAPDPFDKRALYENDITFLKSPAGKWRRYASIHNLIDPFITVIGFMWSLIQLIRLYPDVIISKGGYASVPTVLAGHIIGIPIIIHESDAKPGRANMLASKYAKHIAISFDSAEKYFPKKTRSKIARTGTPIRKELLLPPPKDSAETFKIDTSVPTILVLGGSQGSQHINEILVEALPGIVNVANIIHQTGKKNISGTKLIADIALEKNPNASRYHPFDYLSTDLLRRATAVATLIVSRAGAGSIAEIAVWNIPAILIPIPEEISHDQRLNAYAYAHSGGATVLEEHNLTPHLLTAEIFRLLNDKDELRRMESAGASFADKDASRLIAQAGLDIGIEHES
ncbi:UDP-N-acetylglucosamine--N-acetylmuramyl-(pentapeptide) pyrophosphoryl-undecaprenol N-acetylglucosamine transferase [hydrothermal vent metagenome]|uniref:UDP-N-acetylglucosamine--N-acetylmuramyl-(Pentapeptide) pyrophosphoryl-undecaprenol N-acetylglucosamine transferase n=1 Tax=hydrothermal vent metagenome TaxID=652676 RepID=A0A3B0UMW5_9ZZZZ